MIGGSNVAGVEDQISDRWWQTALEALAKARKTGDTIRGVPGVIYTVKNSKAELVCIAEDADPESNVDRILPPAKENEVPVISVPERNQIGGAINAEDGVDAAAVRDAGTAESVVEDLKAEILQEMKIRAEESMPEDSRRVEVSDEREVKAEITEVVGREGMHREIRIIECRLLDGAEEGELTVTEVSGPVKVGEEIYINPTKYDFDVDSPTSSENEEPTENLEDESEPNDKPNQDSGGPPTLRDNDSENDEMTTQSERAVDNALVESVAAEMASKDVRGDRTSASLVTHDLTGGLIEQDFDTIVDTPSGEQFVPVPGYRGVASTGGSEREVPAPPDDLLARERVKANVSAGASGGASPESSGGSHGVRHLEQNVYLPFLKWTAVGFGLLGALFAMEASLLAVPLLMSATLAAWGWSLYR